MCSTSLQISSLMFGCDSISLTKNSLPISSLICFINYKSTFSGNMEMTSFYKIWSLTKKRSMESGALEPIEILGTSPHNKHLLKNQSCRRNSLPVTIP